MGKHIVDGPLALARATMQTSSRKTYGKSANRLRLLLELRQDLVDRERSVVRSDVTSSVAAHGGDAARSGGQLKARRALSIARSMAAAGSLRASP
jgi:hypothetical protein